MFESEITKSSQLSAYLVGIHRKGFGPGEAKEHLEELAQLVDTMGVTVVGEEMASAARPTATLLLGSGKASEICLAAEAAEATVIVIDDELTPAQQRNWEKLAGKAVIDRREVILDIFGQRAQTREARLQVELAKLEYSLPRLKRAWTHLERQRGGGGFIGGAGEAQIEVDRRIVRDSIARHKKELRAVRQRRATQRKSRQGRPVPTAALVGYTNSGKSTLLNHLTDANVLAEDKLFATLDPTTRRISLPNNQPLLLTDTVGFIRKLPHQLVEAFQATLEEAQVADFLVHVIDASHPAALEHIQATREVLNELNMEEKRTIHVLNKIDLVEDPIELAHLKQSARPCVLTSAATGEGLDDLRDILSAFTSEGMLHLVLRLPPGRHDLISFLYREAKVLKKDFDDEMTVLTVELPMKFRERVEPFIHEVSEKDHWERERLA